MTDITLTDIERGTTALLVQHGLAPTWRFAWDNATRRAGACHWRTHRITLSRPIFSGSDVARADWHDVALHEIAHALAGHAAGHGPAWKRVARSIGCRATRCHQLPTPPRPVVGRCAPGCPAQHDRSTHPKPGRFYQCRLCRTRIEWWDRQILESGVIDAGLEAIAASALAPTSVPEDRAARRSAAARKAWETRRKGGRS